MEQEKTPFFWVERPGKDAVGYKKDTVFVAIMRNKSDGTYSYVNLTKGHVCPCRFANIDEAIDDMEKLVKKGRVLRYVRVDYAIGEKEWESEE